jgi:Winged helix DNA-binding domain
MRTWRKQYAHLDEAQVAAELGAWLAEPRTNEEIRERVLRYEGVTSERWTPIIFARNLLPLVQLPPAGHWSDRRRPSFVVDPRPRPDPADAATLVLARYLAAFGPASRRDAATWAGVAQRDFAAAWERLETVAFRDEQGVELRDLPGQPLPPASTKLPPRLLAHWDQLLLAHADRERIFAPEVEALKLTLSGEPPVTLDGRVAASWKVEREGDAVRLTVTPHIEIRRAARAEIRIEAERTARFCEPDAGRVEVVGV